MVRGPGKPTTSTPSASMQVGLDLAQHLVRLDDLDRRARRVQPQRLPQQVDGTHVHARGGAAAQVQRDTVGFLMSQCPGNTLT